MGTLSPQAEEKLIGSLKTAVSLVDKEGMPPDAAMSKIAKEEKWGQDMIRFGCHAYNTGRQTAQRESSDSILEKLATFPLADPDKVIAAVFPSQVKTASQLDVESGVSSEYDRGPTFLQQRDNAAREKAAAARPWYPKVEQPEPAVDPNAKMAAAYNDHVKLKKAAEQARHEGAVAYEGLLKAAGELGEYFKQRPEDRVSFAEFEKVCEVFYPGTKHLHNYVFNRNRMKEARADEKTQVASLSINRNQAPWSLMKAAVDAAKSTFEKRAAHTDAIEATQKHAAEQIRPHELLPEDDPGRWTLLGNVDAVKQASMLGGVIGGSMFGSTGRMLQNASDLGDEESLVSSRVRDLSDPDHEQALKEIQTQALLADLMANDEVIGGSDPQQVSDAYNEIASLAPRASQQPMAIRALLRRHLQGNIEPYEVTDTAKLENSLMGTENDVKPDNPMIAGGPIVPSKSTAATKQSSHWLFGNENIL